jgi:flavin-binding protein dodecin
MSDSLDITTSVNAVVTAVYTSCKTLDDTIDAIDRAPETLQNLRHNLRVLQGSLMSLKVALETMSTSKEELSPHQHTCLSELEPAIVGCQTALDDFEYKISHIESISEDEHTRWLDKACLPYHDKDIILLKSRLGDCKQTLDVAIGIMAL